jgi:multisubunit Na+/H+ antiporter MnhG subunit
VSLRHVLASVLLAAGVGLEVIAVIGVTVMRDALDRLHYVGLCGFGALFVGTAVVIRESFSLIGDKALLTGVVIVAFGPVLVHTTARSVRMREHGDWRSGIEQATDSDAR